MFIPIHLLPQFRASRRDKYQDRWNSEEGRALHDKIMQMIRDGGGEDFLQWEFENGRLGFLEDMWDLKGFSIFNEKLEFPGGDNFEAIDFSYAQLYHSQFKNAVFLSSNFNFTKIYNCEFENCLFTFTGFYGVTLEKVKFKNCEWIEKNSFTNCDLRNVDFINCFFPENVFFDCRFDENTTIDKFAPTPSRMKESGLRLEPREIASIYKGIKEGFVAGEVFEKARHYYFQQMQSSTRHNAKGFEAKTSGYALEYLTGYGVKPVRVLIAMHLVFAISLILFSFKVGFPDALLLVSGALFTFGANAELLRSLSIPYRFLYIGTAFCGVSLLALFITVLATKWLREH